MRRFIVFLPILALCGCAIVPKTRIDGKVFNQPYSFASPKDSELTDLKIDAQQDTNGVGHVVITVGSLKARMNPDVISAQGQANALVTGLYFAGFNQGLSTALNAYLGRPTTIGTNGIVIPQKP